MNVGQSHAAFDVLAYITGQRLGTAPPTREKFIDSLVLLIAGAHKSLGAGESPEGARNLLEAKLPHPAPVTADASELPVFTVTVDDADGCECEPPCAHTYVVHAVDQEAAQEMVISMHARTLAPPPGFAEADTVIANPSVIPGPGWTFPGAPSWPADLPGRTWTDLRGVGSRGQNG